MSDIDLAAEYQRRAEELRAKGREHRNTAQQYFDDADRLAKQASRAFVRFINDRPTSGDTHG